MKKQRRFELDVADKLTCHECDNIGFHSVLIDKVYTRNGQIIPIQNIPVLKCNNCGEVIYGSNTVQEIELKLSSYDYSK